jgi:uncharacterized protein with ParB-like and HNH nuclease domain
VKVIDRRCTKITNGSTQFAIPVFQSDYRWTEAQCERLWRDILQIAQGKTARGHLIGSVVYVSTGDSSAGFTRRLLIDGQQRLTTLTLLLAAFAGHHAQVFTPVRYGVFRSKALLHVATRSGP